MHRQLFFYGSLSTIETSTQFIMHSGIKQPQSTLYVCYACELDARIYAKESTVLKIMCNVSNCQTWLNQITNQQWHANCILCDSHGKSIYYITWNICVSSLWIPKIPYGWYLLLFISHFCSLIVAVCASLAVIYHIINVYMMDDIYHNASYV